MKDVPYRSVSWKLSYSYKQEDLHQPTHCHHVRCRESEAFCSSTLLSSSTRTRVLVLAGMDSACPGGKGTGKQTHCLKEKKTGIPKSHTHPHYPGFRHTQSGYPVLVYLLTVLSRGISGPIHLSEFAKTNFFYYVQLKSGPLVPRITSNLPTDGGDSSRILFAYIVIIICKERLQYSTSIIQLEPWRRFVCIICNVFTFPKMPPLSHDTVLRLHCRKKGGSIESQRGVPS